MSSIESNIYQINQTIELLESKSSQLQNDESYIGTDAKQIVNKAISELKMLL